ncbi:hypothetical protein AWR27_21585 [Spirosoma montaniterrae]|uniref:Secretion system C-terminal sorting domain-containing protein n=1 Tax=Spirosoma montaniterrae TaxID=1178516 RepID=A0A1P9X4V1_9BACT|nr:hypothetical protein AWR27_21585 [Spirosoma montaniterrae]
MFALGVSAIPPTSTAQPFTGAWSFEGNSDGVSSNPLISVSSASYTGVNLLAVNPYTTGHAGLGANIQNWSTSVCNNTEYVQFSVSTNGTAKMTLSSLSFAFARSDAGPRNISVRSSVNGYSSDTYTQTVNTGYQTASIGLSGSDYTNRTGTITFRIYACNPTASGGTLRLDEIKLNGTPLPVELVSFTAKPQGERVQLSWETSWERNAERFEVQRSRDLGEFLTIGSLTAKGTTDQRQQYGFMDEHPFDGANYYRLKQVDFDGTTEYSRPVAVVMDNLTPSLEILGNPSDRQAIRAAVRNLPDATYRLTTLTGQDVLVQSGPIQVDGSVTITPIQPLMPGLYLLRAEAATGRIVQRVAVE